jgi:ABC-type branched-chain amino acid transport systems, periplasmic component
MKRFKKALSLGLVVTLVMATAAGCGTKGSGSGKDDTFVIGGLGPLTGTAASYGISVKQGAKVAVDEINAAGGVQVGDKKLKLSLNFKDDEASEDTAVTAYNSLMDEGIDGLLGCVTSGACIAIADNTNQDGILQITPSGSAVNCIKHKNAFRLCFTDPVQGITMADYATGELGKKKIAVIFNNSDEYSTGIKDAFEKEVKAKGGEIVASEAFSKGDVDFTTQLTSIKSSGAEVIFIPAYYGDVAYITKQAKDLAMSIPFIGSDGWDGVIAQVTDPSVLEGSVFLSPFFASDTNEAVVSFVKKYKDAYKTAPDQFAADGYDTVYVFKAALEKAGTKDSKKLIAAMTKIKVKGLTGDVTFNENGEPNKTPKFVEIKNGQYVGK